ncbi:MAG TPA: Yip1 family protein [Thermaerobacter sp.]
MTKEADEKQEPTTGGGPSGTVPEPAADAPAPAPGQPRDPAGGQAGGDATPPAGEPQPAMGFIDWIYGVLFRPRETMERVAASERPPLALAIGVAVFVTIASGLATAAELPRLLEPGSNFPLESGVGLPPGGLGPEVASLGATFVALVSAPLGLIFWFVLAGMYHLAADLLGGRGDGRRLLAGLGLAMLPEAFVLPVNALAARLPVGGDFLNTVAGAGLFVWSFYLTYRALRATKHLPRWRGLFTALLPGLALVALLILAFLAVFFSVIMAMAMA